MFIPWEQMFEYTHSQFQIFYNSTMAGILQNVFNKGIYSLKAPENVSKLKTLVNHSALYFGLIVYTAIGAKVGKNEFLAYVSHEHLPPCLKLTITPPPNQLDLK